MAKFTEQEVIDFVIEHSEAESARVEKKLTEDTWTVLVSIFDGMMRGERTYKFRECYVDVSGNVPRIMGLWF